MRSTIPRKQVAKNEHFANAWQNIEQLVSRDEAQALVASTVNDIKLKTAGQLVAYAWSGGKDSLALQYVCEQAGIHRCVFCTSKALEYPAFLQWVYQYHPVGMTTINLDNPDAECDLDYVPHKGVEGNIDVAVSASLGFGGHNGIVVIKKFKD